MEYKPIGTNDVETYKINSKSFNYEYYVCKEQNKITNKMGYYLLQLANNCVAKYHGKYNHELIVEMHQYIIMDITERLLSMNIRYVPFATVSITMQNRCKNFIRNVNRGNIDVYGVKIGDKSNKIKFIQLQDNENN